MSADWFDWPALPDLFPVSFPGVQTGRDEFLVDVDLDRLRERVGEYFDTTLSHEEIAQRYQRVMQDTRRFDAREVRDTLLVRGGPNEAGFVRYTYRPFDNRWLYWGRANQAAARKRVLATRSTCARGTSSLSRSRKPRRAWSPPQVISQIGCIDLMDRSATCIPAWLREEGPWGRYRRRAPCQSVSYGATVSRMP